MARYFSLSTTAGDHMVKVSTDWFPSITNGTLVLPGGERIDPTTITQTLFITRRETPARDAKLAAIERAKVELAEAQALLGIPVGTLHSELENYVDAAVALAKAQDDLVNHDLALVRAKESAKKAKENPKPKAEAKPKAKKASKK